MVAVYAANNAAEMFAVYQADQLLALAAAHPEAYTALIDCCTRSDQLDARDMFMAAQPLSPALHAVLGSKAALANTAAVAGLASALTSLVKRAMQFIIAAASMQGQPAAAGREAAACFPAAVPRISRSSFL
jgi:hypothetical protein